MEELGEVVRSHDPLSLHVLLLVVEYGWDIRVGLLVRERDEGSLVERKAPVSFEEIYGMQTYWGHSLPDGQDIWSQAEEAISIERSVTVDCMGETNASVRRWRSGNCKFDQPCSRLC